MRLLVDIGNTRIKWRWADEAVLRPGGSEPLPPAGHEAALFSRIWGGGADPVQVVVSNVAGPHVRAALEHWCWTNWRATLIFVASEREQCGVCNGYDEPGLLGVDRWCGLIGARALVSGACCVVDCGTAITLDLLAADGSHQGGLIVPGLRGMAHTLTSTARGLRVDVAPTTAANALGRNTVDCIRAGILAAATGMVEHTLERLAAPADTLVLLTGGDAAFLAPSLRRTFRIEPELVFHGLARIAMAEGRP